LHRFGQVSDCTDNRIFGLRKLIPVNSQNGPCYPITPLSKFGKFEGVIARFAPGLVIHLTTLRDGELFDRTITLGYVRCPSGLSASNLAASAAKWSRPAAGHRGT